MDVSTLLASTQADVIRRMPQYAQDALEKMKRDNPGNVAFKNEPYVSKIRFEPTIAVDGSLNVTFTFKQGLVATAFSYGVGGAMASAGYVATGTGFTQATIADTNLILATGRNTNGGDMFVIDGISFLPTPKSDPLLTNDLIADLSVQAGFNGQTTDYKLGNPLQWPAGGGLWGAARTPNIMPGQADASGVYAGSLANGIPSAGDIRWFNDPIVWMPGASGDGIFALTARVERDVVVVAPARAAGTGIVVVTPPSTPGAKGTFVEFQVTLYGNQFGPRSRNR